MIPALLGMLEGVAGGASAAGAAAGSSSVLSTDLAALTKNLANNKTLSTFNAEFSKTQQGFGELQQKMAPLQQSLGTVKQAFNVMGGLPGRMYESALSYTTKVATLPALVTKPLTDAIGIVGSFRDSVTGLGSAVSQFTQLANPALTQQFAFAAQDLTASLGRGLIPVLDLATQFTRMFGDAVYSLSGPFAQLSSAFIQPLSNLLPSVTNAMGPVVRTLGDMMSTAGAIIRPFTTIAGVVAKIVMLPVESFFRSLEVAMRLLETPIELLGAVLTRMANTVDRIVSKALAWVRSLLGMPDMAGADRGAAVRSAGLTSSDQFQQKAWQMAFTLGTGAAPPEERMARTADQILNVINAMPEAMWQRFQGLSADIATELKKILNSPAEAVESAKSAAGGLADSVVNTVPGGDIARDAGRRIGDLARRWLE
jgi:hypothetical protein